MQVTQNDKVIFINPDDWYEEFEKQDNKDLEAYKKFIAAQLIDHLGGTRKVAKIVHRTQQAISEWKIRQIPLEHVPLLCRLTEGLFKPKVVRPDFEWDASSKIN
jgi:DNA-binding transcriptional regulator YdaS (Cro superfamily)